VEELAGGGWEVSAEREGWRVELAVQRRGGDRFGRDGTSLGAGGGVPRRTTRISVDRRIDGRCCPGPWRLEGYSNCFSSSSRYVLFFGG